MLVVRDIWICIAFSGANVCELFEWKTQHTHNIINRAQSLAYAPIFSRYRYHISRSNSVKCWMKTATSTYIMNRSYRLFPNTVMLVTRNILNRYHNSGATFCELLDENRNNHLYCEQSKGTSLPPPPQMVTRVMNRYHISGANVCELLNEQYNKHITGWTERSSITRDIRRICNAGHEGYLNMYYIFGSIFC